MTAFYNENEPYAAQWTRNLIAAGHVAPGVVDDRSIVDLTAADVAGAGQRHFFAGLAVWSHALRLAGVPDDVDLFTGSCPCQGFSSAGLKRGFADVRHLWPVWFGLIAQCRPRVVLGEQVASRGGLAWLDLVLADLEGAGYAVRAADTCAASVGAPHIRQRIYFVAYTNGVERRLPARCEGREGRFEGVDQREGQGDRARPADDRGTGGMANPEEERRGSRRLGGSHGRPALESDRLGPSGELGNPGRARGGRDTGADACAQASSERTGRGPRRVGNQPRAPGPTNGFWADADWIPCSDGKSRPVEPGTSPLVDGAAARVGGVRPLRAPKIRGYGNAICAPQAAAFIAANLDVILGDA